LARFGPTTPTRATTSLAASVESTEARNDILGCFGRSDNTAVDVTDGTGIPAGLSGDRAPPDISVS
jgi:hypothetical protein